MANISNIINTDNLFHLWPAYVSDVSPDKMLADIHGNFIDHAIVAYREGIR